MRCIDWVERAIIFFLAGWNTFNGSQLHIYGTEFTEASWINKLVPAGEELRNAKWAFIYDSAVYYILLNLSHYANELWQ